MALAESAERARLEAQLTEHGQRREEALVRAEAELAAIVDLLPAAQAAGISLKRAAELAQVTRPTLYARRDAKR